MEYEGFTEEDVRRAVTEGGADDAWAGGPAFLREIDPEEMSDTAVVYARAAAESVNSMQLAERSDALGGASGAADGIPFTDAEQRLAETARALQGRGAEGVYTVVDMLRLTMADAMDTRGAVSTLLHGPDGLHATVRRHIAAAENEWSFAICQVDLPDDAAATIRDKHLRAAVGDARPVAEDVTDAIHAYRTRMVGRAGELGALGYDVTDGALDLWLAPGNAAFVAQGVRLELEKAQDSPEDVDWDFMLRNMEQLLAVVRRADTSPPNAELTPEDYAYLDAFYEHVGGGDAFVNLGRLLQERDDLGLSPADDDRLSGIAAGFADGMLTAYGHDTVWMPDSMAHLFKVYSWRESGSAWRDFEKFGEVLGYATATPSRRMVEDLVSSAVVGIRSQHANTGSDGVLHAALLNRPVAAEEIGRYDNYWADKRLAATR
ncbi:hypothetical protein [Streptomyces avicenniae]|uniref:hypothetical protein n=1 Tax=Streptomyces avicenniae TaxID=500153 RepID=UPI00069AFB8C|nr:hypothetical protein [Streptomyces avicenniae]